LLIREGGGRSTRYRSVIRAALRFEYPLHDLSEDAVWKEIHERSLAPRGLSDNVERILHYAVTELVNNAIDHSGGTRVEVVLPSAVEAVVFEVIDDGVGIWEHVRTKLGLPDPFAALQELSKGKTTTAPDRHTGEGIFFTSKIADFFEIESGVVGWRVDNRRGDASIASIPERRGTRVRFEVGVSTPRTLARLFDDYTKDYEFVKTRIVVKLFEVGVRFVSRSEAKRLLHGLERFREVVLDFSGVQEVGQGFADEVFRVWPSLHPGVAIIPVRMASAVEFMVSRARRSLPLS
jgi:anti-sigma regulatory factor (Ser/Thr protein kinase)